MQAMNGKSKVDIWVDYLTNLAVAWMVSGFIGPFFSGAATLERYWQSSFDWWR